MVAERGVDAHAVGNRRAGWRVIARVEQKNAQQAAYVREYFVKAEAELPEIFGGIFALMEKNIIPSASAGESKELYYKMKSDCYRYVVRVVAIPAPQIMEEIMEVIRLVSRKRIHERIVAETIDVLVSRVMEETIEVEKLNGSCAAQAPEWKELRGPRDEELVTIRDTNKLLNDCDEPIPEWLHFVKDVVDSEGLPMNVYRETLLQNKILRVINKNHVTKYLEMLAEIAELKDDQKKFYERFVKCMKLETAELLRFNTFKPGDEQFSFEEYVDRMKEGQNDIYCITGENIATVSSRKKGHEVLYVADPVDEYAVHQPKEFNGMKVKPTTKEGLDPGDQDEKNTLDEKHSGHSAGHAANLEGLENKLLEEVRKVQSDDDLKHIGQERVYGGTGNHAVDVPVSQIREKTGKMIQAMQRSTQQRDSSQAVTSNNCKQHNKRERKKETKGEGETRRSEQEKKGREEKESVRKGERGKEERRDAEEE